MSRCHHGYPIHASWDECPRCRAEDQAYEAADAALRSAEALERQTRLMEQAAREESRAAQEAAREQREREEEIRIQSALVESQQLALLAEERARMSDLRGAILLMGQAIGLNASFIPFYYQRARYLLRDNHRNDALSDLRHCFKSDPHQWEDADSRLRNGKPDDFASLSKEVGVILSEIKEEAGQLASASIEEAENAVSELRRSIRDDTMVADTINEQIKLKEGFPDATYVDLLGIPAKAKVIVERASELLQQKTSLKADITRKLNEHRLSVPQMGKYTTEVDSAVTEISQLLRQADETVQRDTYPSLKAASALVDAIGEKLSPVLKITQEIDAKQRAEEAAKARADYEERERIRREAEERGRLERRRNAASKGNAIIGAWILGLLGGLVGCADCVNHLNTATSGFNLFTGAALGALIGAAFGALIGQMKS